MLKAAPPLGMVTVVDTGAFVPDAPGATPLADAAVGVVVIMR